MTGRGGGDEGGGGGEVWHLAPSILPLGGGRSLRGRGG